MSKVLDWKIVAHNRTDRLDDCESERFLRRDSISLLDVYPRWRNARDRARYQVGQDLRSHDISLSSTLQTGSGGRRRKIARLREPVKVEQRPPLRLILPCNRRNSNADRFRFAIGFARRYFATGDRDRLSSPPSVLAFTEDLSPRIWP